MKRTEGQELEAGVIGEKVWWGQGEQANAHIVRRRD